MKPGKKTESGRKAVGMDYDGKTYFRVFSALENYWVDGNNMVVHTYLKQALDSEFIRSRKERKIENMPAKEIAAAEFYYLCSGDGIKYYYMSSDFIVPVPEIIYKKFGKIFRGTELIKILEKL